MTVTPHRMPAEMFEAISRGGGGVGALRLLAAARRSRTLLVLRMLVESTNTKAGSATAEAYQALAHIQRADADAVTRVLDHPSVGAYLYRAVRLRRGDATGYLSTVVASAAVRASVEVDLPMPARRLVLPSLGTALLPRVGPRLRVRPLGRSTELSAGAGRVIIPADPYQAGDHWLPVRRITLAAGHCSSELLLDDWSGQDLPADLRELVDRTSDQRWVSRLTGGWNLLARHHTEVSRELAAGISVLTPLKASGGKHSSATLADAFGCVFLSLPADPRTMAVTLAHELQHTKLSAIMDLFSLVLPDTTADFHVPWRADPRPLIGVLHGTYAFLGVTSFWRRQRHVEESPVAASFAHTEFARWRRATMEVAGLLMSGPWLTPIGYRFVGGIVQVLEEWGRDSVPADAQQQADRLVNMDRPAQC